MSGFEKIIFSLQACLALTFTSFPLFSFCNHWMNGTWVSSHEHFSQIHISMAEHEPLAQVYQRCGQDVCFWGESYLRSYTKASGQPRGASFKASFMSASAQFEMTLYPGEDFLIAEVVTEAFDIDGTRREARTLRFERLRSRTRSIRNFQNATISGRATGPAAQTASLFQVSLYGPNRQDLFVRTESLHNGYTFENLPDGLYWIYVEPRGATGVMVRPEQQVIRLENGRRVEQDIELH